MKFLRIVFLFVCFFILTTLSACERRSDEGSQPGSEASYPAPKLNERVTLPSGLIYIDTKIGEGPPIQPDQMAIVDYVGKLEDGTTFDSSKSRGKKFDFQVGKGQVIQGWDEGVAGMMKGGVRRLIIPSNLAYGETGVPNVIPPNATLYFEVELGEIQ